MFYNSTGKLCKQGRKIRHKLDSFLSITIKTILFFWRQLCEIWHFKNELVNIHFQSRFTSFVFVSPVSVGKAFIFTVKALK